MILGCTCEGTNAQDNGASIYRVDTMCVFCSHGPQSI